MLNELHVEGVVVKTWRFGTTRFARIACYPDPGRTLKRDTEGQDEPEHITLRFEPPLALLAAALKKEVIRVSGYVASRDYVIPLARFAEAAEGEESTLLALRQLAEAEGEKVWKPHVLTEVVVERVLPLPERPARPARAASKG